jgi:hypothetical protein
MAIVKDKIIVSNTYSIAYNSVEPTSDGLGWVALNPVSAYAELWDVQNQAFIELGALGSSGKGIAATVTTNVVSYTLPSNKTTVAGDYKLFITAVYADDQEITEVRAFKILGKT